MTGEVRSRNLGSIAERGTYAASLTTRLASEADAQHRADEIVARQAAPAWVLGGVEVDLAFVLGLSDTYGVLSLDVNDLVKVEGLPPEGPDTEALLWVEGWRETIEPESWRIALAVSDYCRSGASAHWDDVPASQTWDATDPTLTWDNAVCLPPTIGGNTWDQTDPATRWDTVYPDNVNWDAWG